MMVSESVGTLQYVFGGFSVDLGNCRWETVAGKIKRNFTACKI
jgi:hypothetical protein